MLVHMCFNMDGWMAVHSCLRTTFHLWLELSDRVHGGNLTTAPPEKM
jgi:hypothetical protein